MKNHDLGSGITYAAIDIIDIIDAPELRATFGGRADGLEVREVSPDELTDSERRAFGFPVEGGAA